MLSLIRLLNILNIGKPLVLSHLKKKLKVQTPHRFIGRRRGTEKGGVDGADASRMKADCSVKKGDRVTSEG